MASISKEYKAFLQSWLHWVATGAVDGAPYYRNEGLCFSLWKHFVPRQNRTPEQHSLAAALDKEQITLLKRDFGACGEKGPDENTWIYPFGGVNTYSKEHKEKTTHRNQARIDWVRKILEENVS